MERCAGKATFLGDVPQVQERSHGRIRSLKRRAAALHVPEYSRRSTCIQRRRRSSLSHKGKPMKHIMPSTMMTQHPDSASRYVPIQDEPAEAVEALTPAPGGFGIDEVMIDFEGKLTPYHQTAQVVNGLFEAGLVPGRDVFVTPRIASATKETTFKQLMALLSVGETNYLVQEQSSVQAVSEVILPMVENAEEVLNARRRIEHVMRLAHDEFGIDNNKNAITVKPILEE